MYRCGLCGNESDSDYCYFCNHVLDCSDEIAENGEEEDYISARASAGSYSTPRSSRTSVRPVKMRTDPGYKYAEKESSSQGIKQYIPLIIVILVIAGGWAFFRYLRYCDVKGLISDAYESGNNPEFKLAIEQAQYYGFTGLEQRAKEEQAKSEEWYSVGSAIRMYRALGTEAANKRIKELEPYAVYEGAYVEKGGETREVFIGLRDGKLYYATTVKLYYAPVGEELKHSDSDIESTDYLDLENMILTNHGVWDSNSFTQYWFGTYISVNSEKYKNGDLSDTGYLETQIPKPKPPEETVEKPKLTAEERKQLKKQLEEDNAREYDPADYDDPEEFADDAFGVDYDDWDEAEEAWYDY